MEGIMGIANFRFSFLFGNSSERERNTDRARLEIEPRY